MRRLVERMDGLPDLVGRYELQERLAEGGFATVYRAYDAALDRDVALKVLYPHFARTPSIRERFIQEGRALARVRHPNLVVVYEAGEVGDTVYLATELIEGYSLDDLVTARGPLPLAEVLPVADQVAAALSALHQHQLIHRDVKPANIMLEERTRRAVLLDLGIARDLSTDSQHSGWVVGTLPYMAPEQVRRNGRVTPRTDVYQLGATLYTLLAGRPPFAGDQFTVLDAVQQDPPPDLQLERDDLPPAVPAAVAAAMAKEPGRRPPGPDAFAILLRRAVDPAALPPRTVPVELTAPLSAPTAPTTEERPRAATTARAATRPRRRWLLAAALALVALLLLPLGWLALRQGGDGARPVTTLAQAEPSAGAAARPAPVISGMALYDSRLTALDGEFEVADQFRACITGTVVADAAPLQVAVTARPEPPSSATTAGVLALSEPVTLTSARQCLPVTLSAPALLPYRTYWAHLLAPAGVLLTQPFRVRPRPEDILLSDSFDDPAKGVLPADVTLDTNGTRARYQGSAFTVQYPATRLNRSRIFDLPVQEDDAVLSVEARLVGETAGRHVIAACRQSQKGWYRADIDPAAGVFRIIRGLTGGQSSTGYSETNLIDWQPSEAIHRGEDSNRYVLRCIGDLIELAINGSEVASLRDSTLATGRFGIGAGVRQETPVRLEARFDNLVVARPPRPVVAGLPALCCLKVYNSATYRQEGEFAAPYRFTACLTLNSPAEQPVQFVATADVRPPATVDGPGILARSETVMAPRGETCRAVNVLAPPLMPARNYWVHAFVGASHLTTAHFRAAPEDSDLLYRNEFDDPADGASLRPTYSTGRVEGGAYRLTYGDPECKCTAVVPLPGRLDGGAALRADIRLHNEGTLPAFVALTCTLPIGGYQLNVSPQMGAFALYRFAGDTRVSLADMSTRALARDPEALNRLELSCTGGVIRVSINGEQVAAVEDSTYKEAAYRFAVALWGPDTRTEAIIERVTVIRQ